MWVLALVYLYFMAVEELTATYAAPEADRHVAHEVVGGRFAPIFWSTAGSLFLTFLLPFLRTTAEGINNTTIFTPRQVQFSFRFNF